MANSTNADWDITDPADNATLSDGAKQIRLVRDSAAVRVNKEHVTLASSSAGGEHKAGSAVAYGGTSAPTQRPDAATSLTSADNGRLWYDASAQKLYVYVHPSWVQVNASATNSKTAVVQEVQTAGTHGGTFTSGSWVTRTLNTTSYDPDSIISSLASNRFTLGAGTYRIHARAPALQVDKHQLRLAKDPAGTPVYYTGKSCYNNSAATYVNDDAEVDVVLTLAGATTFEIQHRCQTTKANIGLGNAGTVSFSTSEIYSRVTITKLH